MSKNIFMFEGQGTFEPGFGKSYLKNSTFKGYIEEISDLTKIDISDISWGKSSIKTPLDNKKLQISIFAVNYAIAKTIEDLIGTPNYVLGHSLGEVCALIYAKKLSLEDGCKLILKRGELMQNSTYNIEQGMLAIAISKNSDLIDSILNNNVSISNLNSSEQIVVSGLMKNLIKVKELCIKNQIKSTLLKTNIACHNSILNETQNELSKTIDLLEFNDSEIDFIPINLNKVLSKKDEIKENLKVHIVNQVDWQSNMHYMASNFLDYNFIEIGSSNILKNFYIQDRIDLNIKLTRNFIF
ncbi:ACP S-malonyltransferase [Arcobacter vandammei]|uniref:ACP S-malonyltransferase n=1 Tax=Arcobacter vandammei TaxID=2782243 RepID=UPI0018DF2972|nr:ACP S-malonyltransferase [Arcobacter vandammei]